MTGSEQRKKQEKEFHDRLRTDAFGQRWAPELEEKIQSDPLWDNMKYYAISVAAGKKCSPGSNSRPREAGVGLLLRVMARMDCTSPSKGPGSGGHRHLRSIHPKTAAAWPRDLESEQHPLRGHGRRGDDLPG